MKSLIAIVVVAGLTAIGSLAYIDRSLNSMLQEVGPSCGLNSYGACDSLKTMRQQTVNFTAEPITFEQEAPELNAENDKPSAMVESNESGSLNVEEPQPALQATPPSRSKPPTSTQLPVSE